MKREEEEPAPLPPELLTPDSLREFPSPPGLGPAPTGRASDGAQQPQEDLLAVTPPALAPRRGAAGHAPPSAEDGAYPCSLHAEPTSLARC